MKASMCRHSIEPVSTRVGRPANEKGPYPFFAGSVRKRGTAPFRVTCPSLVEHVRTESAREQTSPRHPTKNGARAFQASDHGAILLEKACAGAGGLVAGNSSSTKQKDIASLR